MNDSTTPRRARDLDSRANSKPNPTASKQSPAGTRVDAEIKVEVGTVLVSAREAALRAKRVARSRAEVGDLHDDGIAGVGKLVAAAVGLRSELPASAAGGTGACAWADAEFVLGDGCAVAGLRGAEKGSVRSAVDMACHGHVSCCMTGLT